MIIQLIADVEGRVVSSDTTTFSMGNFTVNLHFNDEAYGDKENRLDSISIERELTEEEANRFKNRLEPEAKRQYRWELEGYEELKREAMNKLQSLESFFGLHGINRVRWDSARTEFVPQSEEEEGQLAMGGYEISQSYPTPAHEWNFDFSAYDWEKVERLKVPLAFYRRGKNRYENFDYVSAFIDYYFVIEGLFAEGDWQGVEDQYIGSEELMACAEMTLDDLPPEKCKGLEEFFEFYSKEQTPEGYLRLITTLRHQFHHYFHEDETGPHDPNPFISDDYQPVALALGHTVYLLLLCRVEEIDPTESSP